MWRNETKKCENQVEVEHRELDDMLFEKHERQQQAEVEAAKPQK